MNKADVEFTIGLNTSPAEQQLNKFYEKMRASDKTSPLLQQVANEYNQGFKMVGSAYDSGSNRFGVPSTQVLNTTLVATTQTLRKFESTLSNVIYMSSRVLDDYLKKANQLQIEYKPSSFSEYRSNAYSRLKMTGNPYSTDPSLIGNTYDGYIVGGNNYGVPSTVVNSGGLVRTGRNISNWSPSEFYTRDQVDAINYNISHNDIFNDLIYKRKAGKSFSETYDIFNQIHSPMGASGMYDIWSGLFGKKGILSLPAPKNVWAGADGIDTPEEQGKDIVEQEKKDNDELKEKLRLWMKIGSTIYAIRKVIQGLAKLWKFGAGTATSINSNINEEHGFFSVDPEGALRANSDKTRAMWYAGIRNMGSNSPVSKSGIDEMASIFTEMWTAAMSGRNVDARTTIDAQRIKEFFGADYTIEGLLTGMRDGKTATDIQRDLVQKVEQQIYKLAEVDEIQRGQLIDSLKHLFGSELIDALVANSNKNMKLAVEDRMTVIERLESVGGSAIPSTDLTAKTTKAVTAITELRESLQILKNTILSNDGINNAFVKFTNAIKNLTDWLTEKLNKVSGEKNAIGEVKARVSIASLTSDEYSRYRNFAQKENDAKDKYKNKPQLVRDLLKSNDPFKILSALYLSQPELKTAADVENLGIKQQELELGYAIKSGKLEANSSNPIIRKLANYAYKNPNTGDMSFGYEAFKEELATNGNIEWNTEEINRLFNNPQDMSEFELLEAMRNFIKLNPKARDVFSSVFNQGGMFDFNTVDKDGNLTDIIKYLYSIDMLGSAEEQFKAFQALAKESYKVLDNTVNLSVEHNDSNRNGKIDAGEIFLTVVVKDQYGNETRTPISAYFQ